MGCRSEEPPTSSIPTVSKVLNGRADIAPETRERIQSLLNQFGYARSSRKGVQSIGLIDLVLTELNAWTAEIKADPPTAVFATSDIQAMAVYEAARQQP
jgi:DNA-binding LacI/PurR family transcriptional regulator